jgi:hypothetical protein
MDRFIFVVQRIRSSGKVVYLSPQKGWTSDLNNAARFDTPDEAFLARISQNDQVIALRQGS